MYDDESSDELLRDDLDQEDTAVEPADEVVHPEPEPMPEPMPEPTPEPAPQPVPTSGLEEFNGDVLSKMAGHLRKRERLSITVDDAMWKILTDPATNAEYKKLKDLGKF